MHNNTYNVVGTSVLNNVLKIRFANGLKKREGVLKLNGHTNIKLIECEPMLKLDAAKFAITYALQNPEAYTDEEVAVFANYVKNNTPAE